MAIMETNADTAVAMMVATVRNNLLAAVRAEIAKQVDPIVQRAAESVTDALLVSIVAYRDEQEGFGAMHVTLRIDNKEIRRVVSERRVLVTTELQQAAEAIK